MQTELLSKLNAKLNRLSLARIQLHREDAHAIIQASGHEQLLYLLTGSVRVLEYREAGAVDLRTYGGRRSVWEPNPIIVRLHPSARNPISLILASETADMLLVSCERQEREFDGDEGIASGVMIDQDAREHLVGEGAYERVVREFKPPEGFELHTGETISLNGTWSSWPSHSTTEEQHRYAEHEEIFFEISTSYAIIYLDGTYQDGTIVHEARVVKNGECFVVPLGNHPIVSAPQSKLAYIWFYRSFLQKTYNAYAHHVNVYVR